MLAPGFVSAAVNKLCNVCISFQEFEIYISFHFTKMSVEYKDGVDKWTEGAGLAYSCFQHCKHKKKGEKIQSTFISHA